MKSRSLIISTVLLASSVAVAAPAQAHQVHHDLWPLYGLTGLILLDAYSHSHHHHKHHYYGGPHYRYQHRRDYSYGHPGKHGHRHRGYAGPRHR